MTAAAPLAGGDATRDGRRPAILLDRDGTLIRDEHYLADPTRVVLVDGAAAALARFRGAGYAIVVITNQSGIGRGLISPAQYDAVRARLDALLDAAGAPLDGTFTCPHFPAATGPCACRKPGTELYTRAAGELGLDLGRSVLVGDRWRDIAAAPRFGARGILIPGPDTPPDEVERATEAMAVARTLSDAADLVLSV